MHKDNSSVVQWKRIGQLQMLESGKGEESEEDKREKVSKRKRK